MKKVEDDIPKLNVIARAPFHLYFEGEADSVTAINKVGQFDILSGHADFFSVLIPCNIVIETGKDTVTFPISDGIITVRDNEVLLFVNM